MSRPPDFLHKNGVMPPAASSSASYQAGKRGRHRHRHSPETRRWEAEHLLPERPSWMDSDTYRMLADLRRRLS